MDNKIVEKIQKLLSLGESCNENEAKVAMLKAQELLMKHKLSMREVKEFKSYNSTIKEKVSNITFTKAKWKAQLARVIADNFGCFHYFKTYHTHKIVFFGREEDITVCNIVLEYAIDCINSKVNSLRYSYRKEGYNTKGIENDYALGFVKGLNDKFEEQKRKNQKWGLVLVKDAEVVEAHDNIKFRGEVNTNTQFQGYTDVYYQGQEDGKKFDISDKIAEDDSDEIFELKEGETMRYDEIVKVIPQNSLIIAILCQHETDVDEVCSVGSGINVTNLDKYCNYIVEKSEYMPKIKTLSKNYESGEYVVTDHKKGGYVIYIRPEGKIAKTLYLKGINYNNN